MTQFYIKTDLSVAGPFTGIELREAALAGILRPHSLLSDAAEGPFVPASNAGLFGENGAALPHPPGTEVPAFQVQGMPGAFMGPFKLRELIGFACQGMLPPGAKLQSAPDRPWIPITGTGILPACLRGDLVRIHPDGKLLLRTTACEDSSERKRQLKTIRAPIDLAKAIQVKGATTAPLLRSDLPSQGDPQQETGAPPVAREDQGSRSESKESQSDHDARPSWWQKVRERGDDWLAGRDVSELLVGAVRSRLAMMAFGFLAMLVAVPFAYSSWVRSTMPRERILGQWVGPASDQELEVDVLSLPKFAVSFTPDGHCTFVNTIGESWSGDFEWIDRSLRSGDFAHEGGMSVKVDEVAPGHFEDFVEPSDGYLQLRGFVKRPPMLDGRAVRDLFVRREGEKLLLGYLTAVEFTDRGKKMTAGWVSTQNATWQPPDVIEHLSLLPPEYVEGTKPPYGSLPINEAVLAAADGVPEPEKGRDVVRHGCLAFSYRVDSQYMLRQFGIPDEARPLYPFEVPRLRITPSFEGTQVWKYGPVKFLIDPEGKLQYVGVNLDGELSAG